MFVACTLLTHQIVDSDDVGRDGSYEVSDGVSVEPFGQNIAKYVCSNNVIQGL